MYNVYKHGVNLAFFYNNENQSVVALEYDFDLKGFRELSDYLMCKTYIYHDRYYQRDKPGNRSRYYRLLAEIPPEVWEKAYSLFK